jgi:peroxin-5
MMQSMTNSPLASYQIDTPAADNLREDDVISEYREQLKTNRKDYLTWMNLGDALLSQRWNTERFSISLACYRTSLELHPDNPEVYQKIGNVLKRLGRQDEALTSLKKALTLDPGMVSARFSKMDILCPILYENEEDII